MVSLKGVPALLSPELLYALARMGHGDEIGERSGPGLRRPPRGRQAVLADLNFPASSICQSGPMEIRADGLGIPQLLEAVLKLLPLDTYVESPAVVMELVPSDKERGLQIPVWTQYESILFKAGCSKALAKMERFEFYERAKKAFAVVATGETALYGNLILKKGVLALSPLLEAW
ncbi:fucose mutarotase isoform X1 [Callithrix jacchus]